MGRRSAEGARSVYLPTSRSASCEWLRGHWVDRLPAIDADIADMSKRAWRGSAADGVRRRGADAVLAASHSARDRAAVPTGITRRRRRFKRESSARSRSKSAAENVGRALWYRHFDQGGAVAIGADEGHADGDRLRASIPADYTASPFPCSITSKCA